MQGYNVSNKYVPVKTNEIISTLANDGFQVRDLQYARVNKKEKEGYQKHILRITHPEVNFKNNGLKPEIIITNSYDGTTSFRAMLGIYRLVCSNGLITGSSFEEHRVRHVGSNVANDVLAAVHSVSNNFDRLKDTIEQWSSIKLNPGQITNFLYQAADVVLPERALFCKTEDLFKISRFEDRPNDLFTVYNVIQENSLKGGTRYYTPAKEENKSGRWNRTRQIKSIERIVSVNKELFNIAESFAA
jgi:hypothetical protein